MAAIDTNTLLAETKCYACFGIPEAQLLKLGLLRRQLLGRNASADVSAQGLITYASCYSCFGSSTGDLIELALLDQISQS